MLDQCPVRAPNHRTKGCGPRETTGDFRLEISPELRLRDDMYAHQHTTQWKDRYRIRSGIEATHSELKRAHGMGRLRVRRLVKVCFIVACKVIACNIKRWVKAFLSGKKRLDCASASFYATRELQFELAASVLFGRQIIFAFTPLT
jgi:hypothetical protein